MNYKIIIIAIALLFFACEYPEAEQEQVIKKEADKQTEIPIVYTNEKGIATKQAIYKKLNPKGYFYAGAITESYFKRTKVTAPGEEPIGEWIRPFDITYNTGDPPAFKLKQKGRGYVSLFLVKKNPWKFPFQDEIRIDFWAVWE